jgi:hypothetical protein
MNTNYSADCDVLNNPFPGAEKIKRNFSQAYQDLFVLTMLQGKRSGKYLEVGANHPVEFNNTFLLEDKFSWRGISVEIDKDMVELFNTVRHNKCDYADGTVFDFLKKLDGRRWKDKTIDYLSLDCEPAMTTYKILTKIPFSEYKVSVITYETDVYKDGPQARELSREFLINKGFQLVASNVCNGGNPYEDWYVDPKIIPSKIWIPFVSEGAEARELFVCQ